MYPREANSHKENNERLSVLWPKITVLAAKLRLDLTQTRTITQKTYWWHFFSVKCYKLIQINRSEEHL